MQHADLLCFSHLRWDFVFQRPQHLMTRFGAERRVYFIEEPVVGTGFPFLAAQRSGSVVVLTPQLPRGVEAGHESDAMVRQLLRDYLYQHGIVRPVQWFYTPMMLPVVEDLPAAAIAFDCMDELSAFAGAPPELIAREHALLARADVVFTGGHSLFERKRETHPHVYPFPSSVDVAHFAQARQPQPEPADQQSIPRPRIGYCGVIDERMDLHLIDGVARLRPDWQLVMIGPTAKIDPASLPRHRNVHYLGMKSYDELPQYLAGWNVAMLPFARNEATRYISPTKTPEYLAAGRPVVSTSVKDVVTPYGEKQLVRIADSPRAFVAAATVAIAEQTAPAAADRFLSGMSWDRTWADMNRLLDAAISRRHARAARGAVSPAIDIRSGALGAPLPGEA